MTVATPHHAPEEPAMPFSHLPPRLSRVFVALAAWLDRRTAARLPLLLSGILFAHGRRTATSWFRAAGITDAFRPAYHAVYAVGRRSEQVALAAWHAVRPCLAGSRRLLLAQDDSPTARYGPCVEGGGTHHNPTPGPAGEKFVYGPRLGQPGRPGPPPDTGHHRPAAACQPVRPGEGRARAAPHLPLGVPHQAGTGRRPAALAEAVGGTPLRRAGRGRR